MRRRIMIRNLLITISLTGAMAVHATNYYFSGTSGDDSRTAMEARDPQTPWSSIQKLNESMSLFKAGDSVLFRRGDIFHGQIELNCSGSPGAQITLGAFGTGAPPVIRSSVEVGPWIQSASSIWSAPYEAEGHINNFLIDGHARQLGRFPNADETNSGYLRIDSHNGRTEISSSSLASSVDWTGGEAVVRTTRWVLDRCDIRSHQGETIQLATGTSFGITNGYGFFIQDHLSTLDQAGEWYFDPAAKKIWLCWPGDPDTLSTSVTARDHSLEASHVAYITIQDLDFRGSQRENIYINRSHHVVFQRNSIGESGQDAVFITSSHQVEFTGNIIRNSNNNALILADSRDLYISYNKILNTGMRAGMGDNYTAVPMSYELVNCSFEHNLIDSTGYNGIHFGGDSIFIRNNVIANFCMTVDDGAAIYTSGEGSRLFHDRYIENNIVLNGLRAGDGTPDPGYRAADGIYMDDRTSYVEITGNTVANTGRGFYLHNAHHINLLGNTSFNNDKQLLLNHDVNYPDFPITGCRIENNIFFSKFQNEIVAEFRTPDNGIPGFGVMNHNYYCRPADDDATIHTWYFSGEGEINEYVSLGTWQSNFGHDLNSHTSPFSIPAFRVITTLGSNRYENGTFNSTVTGWYCWSNYGNCDMTWDQHRSMDGGSMKLGFTGSSGRQDGYLLAMGNIGEVASGSSYVMKFSLIAASPGKTIKIVMRRDGDNSDDLAPATFITLETSRREYELLFSPSASSSSARIDFVISEEAGSVWIDNLELVRADVKKTDMNENVRFLFNPHNSVMTFQTEGEYYGVDGQGYTDFTLQPFASLILIHPDPEQAGTILSVKPPEDEIIALYPNPANRLLYIRTNGSGSKVVRIYDLPGSLIKETNYTGRELEIDISAYTGGIYLLQVLEEGRASSSWFLKN